MVTAAPAFGRSATVAPSERGGQFAKSIVALDNVSVTGGEYPELFSATAGIQADMLIGTVGREVRAVEFKDLTSSPRLRSERTPAARDRLGVLVRAGGETAYVTVEKLRAQLRELLNEATEKELEPLQDADALVNLAEQTPHVAVSPPQPVELSGNLTRDVLAVTGLTAVELAAALGRTERSVRLWIAEGHPPVGMRPELQRLRTIGLRLVGGLGSAGARRWLMAGSPSPLERITAGDTAGLLDETGRLLSSPAT